MEKHYIIRVYDYVSKWLSSIENTHTHRACCSAHSADQTEHRHGRSNSGPLSEAALSYWMLDLG